MKKVKRKIKKKKKEAMYHRMEIEMGVKSWSQFCAIFFFCFHVLGSVFVLTHAM